MSAAPRDTSVTSEVQLWAVPVTLADPIFTPVGTFDTYHHLVVTLERGGEMGWVWPRR